LHLQPPEAGEQLRAEPRTNQPDELLGRLLKDVSRSFYLTLVLLPKVIRPQIGLAYLLARTSDTIADTTLIPLSDRLKALETLGNNIRNPQTSTIDFKEFGTHQGSVAERTLLERIKESLELLNNLEVADRTRVREVLAIILSGQELDLQRFAGATAENILALKNAAELDDYTYRVAGCVGEFWTRMLEAHILEKEFKGPTFFENGVRFGKGLQLVNILRDLPVDLRQGRCYLPIDELSDLNLRPADLLEPANENRFRPLYDRHLDEAQSHLNAGWNYTRSLPCRNVRMRIACALPLVIAVETIRLLRHEKILGGARIKVPRSKVRSTLLGLLVFYPWGGPWRRAPQ
jgi:farnesyl-diphosphate farnesyltransferase